jgi:hypothetical protein
MASATWAARISSLPVRSAMVRATRRMRSRARAEPELLEGLVQEGAAGGVDPAVPPQGVGPHHGVDRRRGQGAEALELDGAGAGDPPGDLGRALARRRAQLLQPDRRHLDVQVDAVEERSRDPAAVALDERPGTAAVVAGVSQVPARTGVRCSFATISGAEGR